MRITAPLSADSDSVFLVLAHFHGGGCSFSIGCSFGRGAAYFFLKTTANLAKVCPFERSMFIWQIVDGFLFWKRFFIRK
jgi:hypothetical protein